MRAGNLRHRVTIATPTQTQDEYGQQIETFPAGDTVWAEVVQQAQAEEQEQDGTVRKRQIVITVRQPRAVTARSRITFDNADHNVVSIIDPNGDGYLWQIVAERID